MANESYSLSHTKWMRKHHIVFTPKYRRKLICSEYRTSLGEVFRKLCSYKGVEIWEPKGLDGYSGQFKIRMPRSLHRALAEHAQREGISMNQYCVYLLSRNDVALSR